MVSHRQIYLSQWSAFRPDERGHKPTSPFQFCQRFPNLPGIEKFVQEICDERNHEGKAEYPEKGDSCTKNALTEIFCPDVPFGWCRQDTVRSFTFGPSWPGWQYQHESPRFRALEPRPPRFQIASGVSSLLAHTQTIQSICWSLHPRKTNGQSRGHMHLQCRRTRVLGGIVGLATTLFPSGAKRNSLANCRCNRR